MSINDFLADRPDWLYEQLPFIYIAGGALCILKLENSFAVLSGSLLILAGVRVLQMRRKYRRALPLRARKLHRSQQLR